MFKPFLLTLAVAMLSLLCTPETYAQQRSPEESVGSEDATKGRSRGENSNIEERKAKNDPNADYEDAVQPAEKGGRTRGTVCAVIFDNWTKWVIDCYVDGRYRGDVGRYGDGTVYVGGGNTKVYAVAEFTDGSEISYGPITKYCSNDIFKITLHNDHYSYKIE